MRVIVESPYAGDIARNEAYARAACKDCVDRGETPFASHLFFTQFLDDTNPAERALGISMGYDFWEKAEKVVFYVDHGMSSGMQKALSRAFLQGKPFEKRQLFAVDLDELARQTDSKLINQVQQLTEGNTNG